MRSSIIPLWVTRSVAAATGTILTLLIAIPSVSAEKLTPYTDVSAGAYYEDAAAALLLSGALDSGEAQFRPSSIATRAEVAKLLVNVYGSTLPCHT